MERLTGQHVPTRGEFAAPSTAVTVFLRRTRHPGLTLIIVDRRETAPEITERPALSAVTSPAGRDITLLRA